MYNSKLSIKETQIAIKEIKDYFQIQLADKLNLLRVSAPLFVEPTTGLNDNLSGTEEAVNFSYDNTRLEVVHSLAKWKRKALYNYNIDVDAGIYADMNAIRKHEDVSNMHSLYVDQWDWEKIIPKELRTEETLEEVVKEIYDALRQTERHVNRLFNCFETKLPKEITFITSEELLQLYPDDTPKDREHLIAKKHGAVFIKHIGGVLSNGEIHDERSPDYDDWSLNGDILVWNEILDRSFEISSMGIRVCEDALVKQLEIKDAMNRKDLEYHQAVINKVYPYTIGGGIGQSRICMFLLEKAHIGEVQTSFWPEATRKECSDNNIHLL